MDRQVSSIIFCLIILRQDLLLNLGLTVSAKLVGQKAPSIWLSLPVSVGITGTHY